MTPFRKGDDVAAVEHDDTGKPVEYGQVWYGTVIDALPLSVVAVFPDWDEWYFLIDSQGRAWRESGRWRLVPVCLFCDMPVMGTPVTSEGDPTGRKWCSGECRDCSAEGWAGQHYGGAVAT